MLSTLRRNNRRTAIKNTQIYLMLAPHLVFFWIFFLLPVISCVYLGFFDYNIFTLKFVGLKNYVFLVCDHPLFKKALLNTAIFAAVFIPLWLAKAVIIAGLLQQFRPRLQSFFKAAYYLPHVTSVVVISLVWLWLYNPEYGLCNYLLSIFGLQKIMWLGNPSIALYAVIFMQIMISGGASIVLISAAMAAVPQSLYDAAALDGASKSKIFFKITLPLIRPVLLYHIIIGLISSFQIFSNIYVMTKGGPQFSTLTIMYLIYETAFENYEFGLAAAQSVILATIIALISILQFKMFGENVEY